MSLEEIIKSTKFHPSIEKRLIDGRPSPLAENQWCIQAAENTRSAYADAVQKAMDDARVERSHLPRGRSRRA